MTKMTHKNFEFLENIIRNEFGINVKIYTESELNEIAEKTKENTAQKAEATLEIPFPAASQDPKYYINNLSKEFGDDCFDVAIAVLFSIHEICPGALLNVLLREVAKELDLSYEGHISESDEIYVFSPLDAKIHKQDPKGIKKVAYKYFAAFRTYEDAIFGIKMANNIKNYVMRYAEEHAK